MSTKIKLLDEVTINQIAAGEVIENPSSVVKELVENALDAGATEIVIEIQLGGRQLIRISDNGTGISYDDTLLAFERHATSKIRHIDDIFGLTTMGFRGEALASIGSIAKVQLLSAEEGKEATLVIVEGGKLITREKTVRSRGTTIEVKQLFFNVPVRKKFQRSPSFDAAEITKGVTALALANPTVRFTLISDKQTEFSVPASSKESFLEQSKERIQQLLNPIYIHSAVEIAVQDEKTALIGWLVNPLENRPNRTGQHLFLNRRAIFSPSIARAVKEGYGYSLGEHRFPLFVLYLSVDGQHVDVNVHPQKKEVRLRNQGKLSEWIQTSVERALSLPSTPPAPTTANIPSFSHTANWAPEPLFLSPPAERAAFESQPALSLEIEPKVLLSFKGYLLAEPFGLNELVEAQEGVVVIDVKAAFSRVLEKGSSKPLIRSQPLLFPFQVEMSPAEAEQLEENLFVFHEVGISMTRFGPTTFIVDAIPANTSSEEVQELIHHQLERLKEDKKTKPSLTLVEASAHFAANKALSLEQGNHLIKQLKRCSQPKKGLKGEPTCFLLSRERLAEFFKK